MDKSRIADCCLKIKKLYKVFKVVESFELQRILQSNFHSTLFKTKGTGSKR